MVEEVKPMDGYSTSDRLAIALACLAGVMAIILFLVEKTPFTVVGLLVLMVALFAYPVLHFVPRINFRVALLACMLIGTIAFGWYVWPKSKLPSDQAGSKSTSPESAATANSPAQGVTATTTQTAKVNKAQTSTPAKPKRTKPVRHPATVSPPKTTDKTANGSIGVEFGGKADNNFIENAYIHGFDKGVVVKDHATKNSVTGSEIEGPTQSPQMSQECAPGATCAMSSGQQGGITANTVNIAPLSRQLSLGQKSAIKSALQGKVCKITMMGALTNVEDSQAYAIELRDAFKAGGCSVPDSVLPLMNSEGGWYGIKAVYHDEIPHFAGERVYTPPDTPQGVVITALDSANLGDVLVGGGPSTPKDTIELAVGRQPK